MSFEKVSGIVTILLWYGLLCAPCARAADSDELDWYVSVMPIDDDWEVQALEAHPYIEQWKAVAQDEMRRHRVPASVKMAQAIVESGYGRSELATKANNHFGIKCGSTWTGESYYMWDDDPQKSCFRKYPGAETSFRDHSEFLKRPRYAELFTYDVKDYKRWANGLQRAGYATNPRYAEILISTIERLELWRLDNEALGPQPGPPVAVEPFPVLPGGGQVSWAVVRVHGLPAVRVPETQALSVIARRVNKRWHLLAKYNDLAVTAQVQQGQLLYLSPKRRRVRSGPTTHVVTEGQTMHSISQQYGIRLKALYRKNKLHAPQQPVTGARIQLRTKAKSPPRTR